MRVLIGALCAWSFGALLGAALPGCGGDTVRGPATDFETGDVEVLFQGEPFPGCDTDLENPSMQNEPWISVDPNDRDHIAAMWQTRYARGFVAAVTFDGGSSWETSIIPGVSRCTGKDRTVVVANVMAEAEIAS